MIFKNSPICYIYYKVQEDTQMSKKRRSVWNSKPVAKKVHCCNACGNDILPGQAYQIHGRRKMHLKPVCAEADAQHSDTYTYFDEYYWKSLLIPPKPQRRLLRSYQATAEKEYDCDYCKDYPFIHEGDKYSVEVWLVKGKLVIKRRHESPSCWDNPENEPTKMKKPEPRQQEHSLGLKLPMAA